MADETATGHPSIEESLREVGIPTISEAFDGGAELDIEFPPSSEDVSTILRHCNAGALPLRFGKGASVVAYNNWLGNSETGLRLHYDEDREQIIVREGCLPSHYDVRHTFLLCLKNAFAGHYGKHGGRLETPGGGQDFTPDCSMVVRDAHGVLNFPVVAEIGGSQSQRQLTARAAALLATLPGLQVVVLIDVHDELGAEQGRLVAWTMSFDNAGGVQESAKLEFGRTDHEGNAVATWNPTDPSGPPRPSILVPAHGALSGTAVDLGSVLLSLRAYGGVNWKHGASP